MVKAFLIKYSEIGIKGKNRYIFEDALRDRVIEKSKTLLKNRTEGGKNNE